jgi:hypothetical protein
MAIPNVTRRPIPLYSALSSRFFGVSIQMHF